MVALTNSSSKWKKLKTAWVGDIHLGHHETPTSHILANLYRCFADTPDLDDLDILFIEGDVFDRLLSLPDNAARQIELWIFHLLVTCKKRDVAVRVLEGTPGHDWKQPKLFVSINELSGIGADLKYFDKLCIDYEERFGIHVLYVPDEWRPTPQETQDEVTALLRKARIDQVDVACMHGYFPPQMIKKLSHGAHDLDFYLSRVRYFIGIGHIHRYWRYKHIVASGSFDRVCHGEHEPKGYSIVTIDKDKPGQPEIRFVENKGAKKYLTVDCRDKDYESAKAQICKAADSVPKGSAMRIVCRTKETIAASLDYFKNKYPNLSWKLARKDKDSVRGDDDEQLVELVDVKRKTSVITIMQDNISDLIGSRLQQRAPEHADKAVKRLNQMISGATA